MILPQSLRDRSVCIVGLGYVGLTLAVAMADAGFRVHGVEVSDAVLAALERHQAHFVEAGLNAKLAEQITTGRFTFGKDFDPSAESTAYIITVGTPVGDNKRVRFESMRMVAEAVALVLKPEDLVILRSTVLVGTTRDFVKPILDRTNCNYSLAYCPERTLEGKALHELRSLPQIVGGIDANSTFRASQMFSFLTPSIVRVSDPETAETVKLVNNTQRDYIFAFANEVASVCDTLGISAAEVIAGGNLGYPRANLPMPGPVGGPCLEKDPYILAESLEGRGMIPSLAIGARRWNEELPSRAVTQLAEHCTRVAIEPRRIAVAGLAFKGRPATDDLRGTLAIPLIALLRQQFPKADVVGWDPVAAPAEVAKLGVAPEPSMTEAFRDSDLVVIQNNHDDFALADLLTLSGLMRRPGAIYDFWNQHDPRALRLAEGVTFHALGAFSIHQASATR